MKKKPLCFTEIDLEITIFPHIRALEGLLLEEKASWKA